MATVIKLLNDNVFLLQGVLAKTLTIGPVTPAVSSAIAIAWTSVSCIVIAIAIPIASVNVLA